MAKHIHYLVILAFAEGKQIQFFNHLEKQWQDWKWNTSPRFSTRVKWRVKPKEENYQRFVELTGKKSVTYWAKNRTPNSTHIATFCGKTHKLITFAEVHRG